MLPQQITHPQVLSRSLCPLPNHRLRRTHVRYLYASLVRRPRVRRVQGARSRALLSRTMDVWSCTAAFWGRVIGFPDDEIGTGCCAGYDCRNGWYGVDECAKRLLFGAVSGTEVENLRSMLMDWN